MKRIEATAARRRFSELYHGVAYGGDRVVVENHGKPLVALVPIGDLDSLAAAEREKVPPTLEVCLSALRGARERLEAAGVAHVSLFGSVARGQSRSSSDVDVLVDFRSDVKPSLFALGGIHEMLRAIFGRDVSLITRRSIDSKRTPEILRDEVRAF